MKVNVTKEAQEALFDQLRKKNRENSFIRVVITSFGWGGPIFGLTLDESKQNKDYLHETNNVKIVVEKDLLRQYNGFKIDYSNNWISKGFRIIPGIGGSSC